MWIVRQKQKKEARSLLWELEAMLRDTLANQPNRWVHHHDHCQSNRAVCQTHACTGSVEKAVARQFVVVFELTLPVCVMSSAGWACVSSSGDPVPVVDHVCMHVTHSVVALRQQQSASRGIRRYVHRMHQQHHRLLQPCWYFVG